jgi:quinol monooxygenase YgiN
MIVTDKCCTIVPYFKVASGKMDAFKSLCEQFMTRVSNEPKCLFYGFSFAGDEAHCREGYADAEGMLYHNKNVADLFAEVQKIATVTRLEVHGPKDEVDKLRQPLAEMQPKFFILEYGFRR